MSSMRRKSSGGIGANGRNEPLEEIPFEPTELDIVSTKIRTWNRKHPGNIFYRNAIIEAVESCDLSTPPLCREVAQELFKLLVEQRGGRFLKLPEGMSTAPTCHVLTPTRCIEKIIHALKTERDKQELNEGLPDELKINRTPKAKKPKQVKDRTISPKKPKSPRKSAGQKRKLVSPPSAESTESRPTSTSTIPRSFKTPSEKKDKRKRPYKYQQRKDYVKPIHDKPTYRAEQGDSGHPIHPYALELLSKVCSEGHPATAHRVLDTPLGEYTVDTEPEQERLMRMQLRQRFVSAQSIGMTPMDFARRLLSLWGGKLVQVPKPPKKIRMTPHRVELLNQLKKQQKKRKINVMELMQSQSSPPSNNGDIEMKDEDDAMDGEESEAFDPLMAAATTPSLASSFCTQQEGLAKSFDFKPSPTPSPPPLQELQQELGQDLAPTGEHNQEAMEETYQAFITL